MRTEDGYIIQQCLDGKPTAFGFLVEKYKRGVYALAYSEVNNFHDAQDIAQEVFIKAYGNLHSLKRWDSFMGWLYRITLNTCRDWERSASRHPDLEFVEDLSPIKLDDSSLEAYRQDNMYESVRDALESVPMVYRKVLILKYYGGMTVKEISCFLGLSRGTVERRLAEGQARLRKETLDMLGKTKEHYELPASFTFRIVEMVKKIRVNPISPEKVLPWGLSLAVGILIGLLSLSSHIISIEPSRTMPGSIIPGKSRILKVGEIPVDIIKSVSMTPLSGNQENGDKKALAPVLKDNEAKAEGIKIVPDDVKAGDFLGDPVYIYGDYIIVGTPYSDKAKGAAYIFKRDGSTWSEQAKLTAKDGKEEDRFGWSAVINDDYAIVSAIHDDDANENSGSVYIFRFDGMTWVEEGKLIPHGNNIWWGNFGMSMSISDNHLIVGSPSESWVGGAIYIYKCVNSKWEEQAKLISSDWARGDHFGYSVSISGDYAVVGAPRHANGKGSAYIFRNINSSWKEQEILIAKDGEAGEEFGGSVSISGNYAIVGASNDKIKGEWSGSAYIFYNNGYSWKQQAKLISSDLAMGDAFGSAVCISGNYALVGASVKDNGIGTVYAFLRSDISWKERTRILIGEEKNWFGSDISISGNYAVVGAPGHNENAGAVYIFDCINDLALPVESKSHIPATQGGLKNNIDIPNIESKPPNPTEFRLFQNFPNPFNPDTWIPYQLREDSRAVVNIYSATGELIRNIDLGHKSAGYYTTRDKAIHWDGRNHAGEYVSSGTYFYTIQAGDFTSTKKMTVLR